MPLICQAIDGIYGIFETGVFVNQTTFPSIRSISSIIPSIVKILIHSSFLSIA
ncbi:MAG: hypothetical protein SPH94_06120 [Fusobacterium necrophorum]|nr:hypothetical protein [Fusobacterium necrophorum]